jgi:hypothetical protein
MSASCNSARRLKTEEKLCHNCDTKPVFNVIDIARLLILRNLLKTRCGSKIVSHGLDVEDIFTGSCGCDTRGGQQEEKQKQEARLHGRDLRKVTG